MCNYSIFTFLFPLLFLYNIFMEARASKKYFYVFSFMTEHKGVLLE